jgi:hypothetical protein
MLAAKEEEEVKGLTPQEEKVSLLEPFYAILTLNALPKNI